MPLSKTSFCDCFTLFVKKHDTVAEVLRVSSPKVAFKYDLIGQTLVVWNALHASLASVHLPQGSNEFHQNLHHNDYRLS